MRENGFLSDFFTCVGFVPFTTQSHIRETMVNIMVPPTTAQQSATNVCAETERFGPTQAEDSSTLEGGNNSMDPSICTFWCAIAIGALVQGSPIESVERYSELARNGLRSYSGPENAELAKAWTILAYVYLLCGNTDKFREYIALSESFLNASIEQGSAKTLPVCTYAPHQQVNDYSALYSPTILVEGFADIIVHGTTIKLYSATASPGEVKAFCDQKQDVPPKLNRAATELELYRYVRSTAIAFEQAVYGMVYGRSATTACEPSSGAEPSAELTGFRHHLDTAASEVLNVMMAHSSCEFEELQDAAGRPSICSGIGAVIINGGLFFQKAMDGNLPGVLESIRCCANILERFPGLCRFVSISHTLHIMVTALTVIDDRRARELYDTMRVAYNSAGRPGSLPLPALEEWKEISPCCDYFYCRALQRLILSGKMKTFPVRTDERHIHHESMKGSVKETELLGLDGDDSSQRLETNEEVFGSFPHPSRSCGAEAGLSTTCEASPCSSSIMGSTLAQTPVSTASVASSLSDYTSHVGLNADLGSDASVAQFAEHHTDVIAQVPEMMSVLSAESVESDGLRYSAEDEDEIAAEDWLGVADAFDAVTTPEDRSTCAKHLAPCHG